MATMTEQAKRETDRNIGPAIDGIETALATMRGSIARATEDVTALVEGLRMAVQDAIEARFEAEAEAERLEEELATARAELAARAEQANQ
jgi:hypothetical protein